MKVYIDAAVFGGEEGAGLLPCELTAVSAGGLRLEGDGWSIGCYSGTIRDASGAPIPRDGLERALIEDDAAGLMARLRAGGALEGVDRTVRLVSLLLDALESVPILHSVIRRVREEAEAWAQ